MEAKKEINFNSISAMLCGDELTDEQKRDIEAFNNEYDNAKRAKDGKDDENRS